jgi:hypothetical protein
MKGQNLLEDMQRFARKVVEQAKECFDIILDYSEESIQDVDRILTGLYQANRRKFLPEKEIAVTSMIFGAYLGEVFRHNVGGEWAMEYLTDSDDFIIVKIDGNKFMPIEIVYKFLSDGPEESLSLHYQAFKSKHLKILN